MSLAVALGVLLVLPCAVLAFLGDWATDRANSRARLARRVVLVALGAFLAYAAFVFATRGFPMY